MTTATAPAGTFLDTVGVPSPPVHARRPLVAVVASNAGTEVTDLVAPYSIFVESGAVEVVSVAPERRVSPLFPGLEFVPDYAFEDLDAKPDVIVVPVVGFDSEGALYAMEWNRYGRVTKFVSADPR